MCCALQEEEMQRAAEEKQRLEDEEAAKWMNMISVQDTVGAAGRDMAAASLFAGQGQALRGKHTQVGATIDVTRWLSIAMTQRALQSVHAC